MSKTIQILLCFIPFMYSVYLLNFFPQFLVFKYLWHKYIFIKEDTVWSGGEKA